MGLLVDGQWQDRWYDTEKTAGDFVREESRYRNWVTADGRAGPSGTGGFAAEAGRYHLYVSMACPWAHRTLIFRCLKGLQDVISVSRVKPEMLGNGWEFADADAVDVKDGGGLRYLYELYQHCQPDYTGRVTVPVLWDRQQQTIVNNESAEIIRMFNSAFNALTQRQTDYYPPSLQERIDEINERVYRHVNDGVYRCGFATRQGAYEQAFDSLFRELDALEAHLSTNRYLLGERLTEADWRLFTTLIRFDAVYYSHFKCNLKRIEDYPNLSAYVRELYQVDGIAATVDLDDIKRHYYYSHDMINPTRIVPKGPALDFTRPHDRGRLPAVAANSSF